MFLYPDRVRYFLVVGNLLSVLSEVRHPPPNCALPYPVRALRAVTYVTERACAKKYWFAWRYRRHVDMGW